MNLLASWLLFQSTIVIKHSHKGSCSFWDIAECSSMFPCTRKYKNENPITIFAHFNLSDPVSIHQKCFLRALCGAVTSLVPCHHIIICLLSLPGVMASLLTSWGTLDGDSAGKRFNEREGE